MLPNGAGSGNYNSPNGEGSARNDGGVTWDWIENEMANGQDVEIMTGTHWVVVEGTVSYGGATRSSTAMTRISTATQPRPKKKRRSPAGTAPVTSTTPTGT
jgi:hypothetical protein